jgi:dihydrofolate reductase
MRKIIVSTMVSANGVMEDPQNWSFDYWSDELGAYVRDQLFASDAVIAGRVTYEAFAEAWSARAGADDFADRINSLPKFVASRTLKEPLTWNSTLIKGDVVAEIAKLKQQSGQNILQYGTGELTHTLMKHGLIDELRLIVFPVAVGTGGHIFDNIDQTPLKLLETKIFGTGVIALHYQPLQAK